MIDETYEFHLDEHPVVVRINRLGNEFELMFEGPYKGEQLIVVDKDDLVGFYRWLGRNLGPLGEDWKSIVDTENKWPQSMAKDELHQLAEVQQKIIQELQQDMDQKTKGILRDIRDSLQNIEDHVAPEEISVSELRETFGMDSSADTAEIAVEYYYNDTSDQEFVEDVREASGEFVVRGENGEEYALKVNEDDEVVVEELEYENVSDEESAEDVEEAQEGLAEEDKRMVDEDFLRQFGVGDDVLAELKLEWVDRIAGEYALTDEQRHELVRALKGADTPVDVAYAAQDFMEELDRPVEEEEIEDALSEARKQIGGDS